MYKDENEDGGITGLAGLLIQAAAIVAIGVIVASSGCITPAPKQGLAGNRTVIRIGLMPDEATLPYYVAAAEGIFDSYGLNVEIVPFMSAMERDSALISGSIDAAENDPVGVILLRDAGYDIKIVSLELQETPDKMRFAIIASPISDISSVSDLEGKTVAISRNTIIEYITDNLIGDVKVKKTEVKKVPLRLQMLMSGKIDAATLPEPLASYALHQGARLVISDSMLNQTISQTVIVFRADFIDKNPGSVHRFLDAYGEAVRRINTNPERYRALMVEKTHIPKQIASNYTMATYLQPRTYPEADFESVIRWLQRKDLLSRAVSYDDTIWEGE